MLSGLYGASLALVAGWVMLRGRFARAGLAAGWGIIAAGTGVVLLGAVPRPAAAAVGVALAGLGTGVFSTHLGPVFLSAAPHEYLGRVQSVLILAQSAPLLIANPAIGLLSENLGARPVILFWGAGSLAAGAVALAAPAMRGMRRQETSSIAGQSRSPTELKSV